MLLNKEADRTVLYSPVELCSIRGFTISKVSALNNLLLLRFSVIHQCKHPFQLLYVKLLLTNMAKSQAIAKDINFYWSEKYFVLCLPLNLEYFYCTNSFFYKSGTKERQLSLDMRLNVL